MHNECAKAEESVRGACKGCRASVQGGMMSVQGLRGACEGDAVSVQGACKECRMRAQGGRVSAQGLNGACEGGESARGVQGVQKECART